MTDKSRALAPAYDYIRAWFAQWQAAQAERVATDSRREDESA